MAQGMHDFIRRPGTNDPVFAWEAVITTDSVTDPSDDVFAVRLGFSEDLADGPCRWAPRVQPDGSGGVELRYPERGDRALIVESDDAEYWIVEWTPYA